MNKKMNQSANKASSNKNKTKQSHVFRNVREPVLDSVTNNSVITLQVAPNATTATATKAFAPIGLTAPTLTVNGTNVVVQTGAQSYILGAGLRWLYNTSVNFGSYRITRATLIFVGSVGTTYTGQLILTTFRDVMDASSTPQVAFAIGSGAKVFDLATSGSKELRISMPIDTSWKKVSNALCYPGSVVPFYGATNQLINVNSINDLCFGAFSAQVVGAPLLSGTTTVGTFFLDYDVEFKEPESSSLNI